MKVRHLFKNLNVIGGHEHISLSHRKKVELKRLKKKGKEAGKRFMAAFNIE